MGTYRAVVRELADVQATSVVWKREAQVAELALNDAHAPGVATIVAAFRVPRLEQDDLVVLLGRASIGEDEGEGENKG